MTFLEISKDDNIYNEEHKSVVKKSSSFPPPLGPERIVQKTDPDKMVHHSPAGEVNKQYNGFDIHHLHQTIVLNTVFNATFTEYDTQLEVLGSVHGRHLPFYTSQPNPT